MFTKIFFVLRESGDEAATRGVENEIREAASVYSSWGIGCGYAFLRQEDETGEDILSRIGRAACRESGFVMPGAGKGDRPDHRETLFLSDSRILAQALLGRGACTAGYAHEWNQGENFSGVEYVIQEPGWVDEDSYRKIYQRLAHQPWTIAQTQRCIVRELVPDDLDALVELYDAEACRFLEPPSGDREKRSRELCGYITRVYGLFGYGQWAVIDRKSSELIGRIGYNFVDERLRSTTHADADFGYLIRQDHRGRGYASEVCAALLQYGFTQLGFNRISAQVSPANAISCALLTKLGFCYYTRLDRDFVYVMDRPRRREFQP